MSKQSSILRLRSLAGHPAAQSELATSLLDQRQGMEVLLAALQVLETNPHEPARPALLQLYHYYEENGEKRDAAANLRAKLMRCLRQIGKVEDVPVVSKALNTYVFPPPARKEEGALLRSAALLTLSEIDDRLAGYHAARLLVDPYTDEMSGEPALAAARVLAAMGEPLPLYTYAMQAAERVKPEVLAECLQNLTKVPTLLVADLLKRFGESPSAIVLVGVFELLLNHRDGVQAIEFIRGYLRTGRNQDAWRYLLTVMTASGRQEWLTEVLNAARAEKEPRRLVMIGEVLLPLAGNRDVKSVLEMLQPAQGAT